VSEPTPLPAAKATGDDERAVLWGYLDYHRAVLARKAEGITDDQARCATCPPSTMTMLGLIRHMTDVERYWFRRWFAGEDVPNIFAPEEEWSVPPSASVADALAAYWTEIAVVDGRLSSASPDDRGHGIPEDPERNTLRRVMTHMIEEYARHCGHADLIRQAIDGQTGD
jgi:uncharacterized damage-inducible protein DinB